MHVFPPIDDRDIIKKSDVEGIVRELCVSYSHIRRSFFENEKKINAALSGGDVTEAVRLLVRVYSLPSGFVHRIGYSAKMDCPAALNSQFDIIRGRVIKCDLYFQDSKETLLAIPRYLFFYMTAHELAHARMQIDAHPLHTSEFATDVLAMLATGYSKGYVETIVKDNNIQYGYVRYDLLNELFRCLAVYADNIYLK